MTELSREQFEATFSDELHTKAMWECWQESRKALADEQAQSQNERIISDANASREGFYKSMFSVIRGEQAQTVEPVAWIGDSPSKGNGRRLFWSESEAYAYADKYEPLFLHPSPPATGEPYDQQALELCDKCGWKAIMPGEPCLLCSKDAQQVAVPAGSDMTPERAAFFMRRFKKEEKLLGPNEQKAIDYVIAMLAAAKGAKP